MVENTLSSFDIIDNDVRRYANDFSFVDVLGNSVANSRFKNGYSQLKQNYRNDTTYLWEALSAIGTDIGETIYQNVLNYVDNASNIDLCKLTALCSMLKMYGIKYSLLDFINTLPLEIKNIMDVLSINKKYLLKSGVLKQECVNAILQNACDKPYTDAEIANMNYVLAKNKFIISNAYYNNMINGTYELKNDYSYDSNDSFIDYNLKSININREYVSDHDNIITDTTHNKKDDKTIVSTKISQKFTFDKFNVVGADEKLYGVFVDQLSTYTLSSYAGISYDSQAQKNIIGLVFDLENDINAKNSIDESRQTPDIFSNMLIDNLFKHFYNSEPYDSYELMCSDLSMFSILHNVDYTNLTEDVIKKVNDAISNILLENYRINISSIVDNILSNSIDPSQFDIRDEYIATLMMTLDNVMKPQKLAKLQIDVLSSNADYNIIEKYINNKTTNISYRKSDNILNFQNIIVDDDKYYKFLSGIYYTTLSDMCNLHYCTDNQLYNQEIYNYISADLLVTVKPIDISADTRFMKLKNNIELTFNEKEIADNIDNGTDSIDNYNGIKLQLIQNEIDRRHQTLQKTIGELTTRTSYYREQKVKEYFKFIENKFYGSHINMLSNSYILNDQYIEVDLQNSTYKYLLSNGKIDYSLISYVANDLANITMYLARLRENIKIQAQKYYMKGTFNLLSYVVNEYLIEFSRLNYQLNNLTVDINDIMSTYTSTVISADTGEYEQVQLSMLLPMPIDVELNKYFPLYNECSTYTDLSNKYSQQELFKLYTSYSTIINYVKSNMSSHMLDDIQIVEYDDNTEYYNLSTKTTVNALNSDLVNNIYWQNDKTNLKTNFAYVANDIQNFYTNTLKSKIALTDVDRFLSTLYEIGADETYVDAVTSALVLDDNVKTTDDQDNSNKSFTKSFFKYSGMNIGYQPYYNHKNQTHSSYQVHPNLYAFIEASGVIYSIQNRFTNGVVNELVESQSIENLKTNVGTYGNVINIWLNNSFDFSGYQTSYEIGTHKSIQNSAIPSEVIDYDGPFYPPAVVDYINHRTEFVNSVKNREITTNTNGSYYEKYFQHLNLSDADLSYLVNQLNDDDYFEQITKIVNDKTDQSEVYDIYKYGKDRYGNHYVLYKNYKYTPDVNTERGDDDGFNSDDGKYSYTEKENTTGWLWIRLKDYPIAFPAFYGKYPVVDLSYNKTNGKIFYLSDTNITTPRKIIADTKQMRYFFDMEFDSAKRTLLLNSYPLNNPNYGKYIRPYKRFYKKLEHSDILVCNIDLYTDIVTQRHTLRFTEDEVLRYDTVENRNLIGKTFDNSLSSIQSFIGYYKNTTTIAAVYATKYFNQNGLINGYDNTYHLSKGYEYLQPNFVDITVSQYTWHILEQTKSNQYKLDLHSFNAEKYKDYNISDPTIRMNYYDDVMSFTVLTQYNNNDIYTNYVGQASNQNSKTTYPSDTNGFVVQLAMSADTNSFDSFDQYVTTIDTKYIGNDLLITNIDIYNLNSDASYIPQYAGLSGKNDLWLTTKYKNEKYHAIELLGFSRNIDRIINRIDPNADIKYDIDSIDNMVPGRVYEDFNDFNEKLVFTYQNPALYTNCNYDQQNYFLWKVDLTRFSDRELSGVDIIVFNNKNTGKNAYYSGSIMDILSATQAGSYIEAKNYISSDVDAELQLSVKNADVHASGTFNYFYGQVNKSDSNHLNNIESMQFSFTQSKSLFVKFVKNDPNKTCYIQSDTITIVVFNKFNLRQYEYYHYLDERGIVQYLLDDEGNYSYESAYVMLSDLHNEYQLPLLYNDLLSDIVDKETSSKIFLKDISISAHNYLSDIIVLNNYDNISFKYSDEDVFNMIDSRFYYPGYNTIYPSMNASIFGIQTNEYSLENLFDQRNLFIFQTEDSKAFADKIGKVQIPVEINETNCLRVFEDYNPAYGPENPAILSSAHFTTTNDQYDYPEIIVDEIKFINVSDIDIQHQTIDNIILKLKKYGFLNINTESLSTDYEFNTIDFDVNSKTADFKDLLNIYVNYKVGLDGDQPQITLYFNYYNYINSPFVKFGDNNNLKIDTLEGSYLKLGPNEDGLLDINAQFKAYYGTNLYGMKTAKLLTFKIFNISDDKPKFVFYKMFEIKKNSLSQSTIDNDASITINNTYIDLDDDMYVRADPIDFTVKINVKTLETAQSGLTFTVFYNINEIKYTGKCQAQGFIVEVDEPVEQDSQAIAAIKFTSAVPINSKTISLEFKTAQNKGFIVDNKINNYQIDIADVSGKSIEGNAIDFVPIQGNVIFGYEVLLRQEDRNENALISAETMTDPAGKEIYFIMQDHN